MATSVIDRFARWRLTPAGTTPTGIALHYGLFVLGAFAFQPRRADTFETRLLLGGLVVALVVIPPALLLDAHRVAADTDWSPRRWLYLPLGLVPNPIGFLVVGDYLRKRRVALRDGGAALEEPVADQLLRLFGPAIVAIVVIGILTDATGFSTAPATIRYATVVGAEAVFYFGYVRWE